MSELLERLREEFLDDDARYAYAEAFLNSSVAAQIKTLRETQELSQEELADLIGTKQSGISRLENVNYSAWKVETLRKIARAYGLRLKISFEEFGTLVTEIENFSKQALKRRTFSDDPIFNPDLDQVASLAEELASAASFIEQPNYAEVAAALAKAIEQLPASEATKSIQEIRASDLVAAFQLPRDLMSEVRMIPSDWKPPISLKADITVDVPIDSYPKREFPSTEIAHAETILKLADDYTLVQYVN
jgi:transcriptional regulator with XRE-family HTH domain